MTNDIHYKFLLRTQQDDFNPEKDLEIVKQDELFYTEQLFKYGLYNKGLECLSELLRNGILLNKKRKLDFGRLHSFIAEMIDARNAELDFKLVIKKTMAKTKKMKRVEKDLDIEIRINQEAKKQKISKTKAIERIFPEQTRQVARAIAANKKRKSVFSQWANSKSTTLAIVIDKLENRSTRPKKTTDKK